MSATFLTERGLLPEEVAACDVIVAGLAPHFPEWRLAVVRLVAYRAFEAGVAGLAPEESVEPIAPAVELGVDPHTIDLFGDG